MPLEARTVLVHLRKRGVVVYHAAVLPVVPNHRTVVVFLEGMLGQEDQARTALLRLPGVQRVRASEATTAILYAISPPEIRPPHG